MTFVVVNYGESKQLLFNPNCQTRLLLENIKERCHCPLEMEVELSDEYGNLKNITQVPDKYANNVLNVDRENLVLIQVKRNDSLPAGESTGEDVTYIPLLRNDDIITSKFTARLSSRDEPSRPNSRTKKTSRDRREKSNKKSPDGVPGDRPEPSTSSPRASASKRGGSSRSKGTTTPTRSKSRGKPR